MTRNTTRCSNRHDLLHLSFTYRGLCITQFHIEAATRGVLWWKLFLEISQNSQEITWARVSFLLKLQAWETLAQVFSCEFCEISKSTYRTPLVAASEHKLHIFGIVILNTKWKDYTSRENLCKKKIAFTTNFACTKLPRGKFNKNLLPEKRKENHVNQTTMI